MLFQRLSCLLFYLIPSSLNDTRYLSATHKKYGQMAERLLGLTNNHIFTVFTLPSYTCDRNICIHHMDSIVALFQSYIGALTGLGCSNIASTSYCVLSALLFLALTCSSSVFCCFDLEKEREREICLLYTSPSPRDS